MLVKIVHRGGHVELHDRPVLASKVMNQNPRCVVAYPPDTVLMLGHKYYVVPASTIRKLQRNSFKYSLNSKSSSSPDGIIQPKITHQEGGKGDGNPLIRWFVVNKNGRKSKKYKCFTCMPSGLKSSEGDKEGDLREGDGKSMGSPIIRGFSSFNNWQPSLEVIVEE